MPNKNIRNISLKLRLYPTEEQKIYFNRCFGCSRFIYNYYLNERNEFYERNIKNINDKEQRNKIYKTFKETPLNKLKEQYPWLKEVEAQILCNSQIDIHNSFNNFFKKNI